MVQRLQKILSERSVASRRRAEELIGQGLVYVNGVPALLGDSADPDVDIITVEGKPLPSAQKNVYIMLNKPRGYVTTLSDERGRPTAAQLVSSCGVRVYPIGRLDMDSEGLLLFTNDGNLANAMMHPKQEVEKAYLVWVIGYYPGGEESLAQPITLEGYTIKPPKVHLRKANGNKAQFEIIIHEGRNRQIRRMCEAASMKVIRLKRIREGRLTLGNLKEGQWRYLSPEETAKLV